MTDALDRARNFGVRAGAVQRDHSNIVSSHDCAANMLSFSSDKVLFCHVEKRLCAPKL